MSELKTADHYIKLARQCGAVYQRQNPTQPLVGLKTKDPNGRRRVSDGMVNFGIIAANPEVFQKVVEGMITTIAFNISLFSEVDAICGIPTGGLQIARRIAEIEKKPLIEIEKVKMGDSGEYELRLVGSPDLQGKNVVVVEDVVSTGLTCAEAVWLLLQREAHVFGCAAFCDRSQEGMTGIQACPSGWRPLCSLVKLPMRGWSEDDPEVAEDIRKGRVIWDPKQLWSYLRTLNRV